MRPIRYIAARLCVIGAIRSRISSYDTRGVKRRQDRINWLVKNIHITKPNSRGLRFCTAISDGTGMMGCRRTACASAAAEARGTADLKKAAISRAEGGQLQAPVGLPGAALSLLRTFVLICIFRIQICSQCLTLRMCIKPRLYPAHFGIVIRAKFRAVNGIHTRSMFSRS
jgi:hypothetical protein